MSNVSGVIKSIQDIMRKDVGVDGDAQRISQLVWLFFLKILDDREDELELTEDDYKSPLPEKIRWRNWAKDSEGITGDDLLNFVNNELFPTLKNELKVDGDDNKRALVIKNVFEDAYNYMKSGTLLRQVINKVCEINFNASGDRHMFGGIYEQILKDLQSAGNAGEFYTPRAVTTFIVNRIAPKLEETVLDPACGTGGFLTNVIEYKRKHFVKTTAEEEILQKTIFGVEKKTMPHMLCTTNMILHGIDVPINIKHDNTLARPLRDYSNTDRVNVVVTNPPFGGMEEDGIENNFPATFRTRETANLFMALIMHILKNEGRAAVVLPDGFLFGEGIQTRLKEKLLTECNLHTIVRLPNGVFNPYTGIRTNILFFTKGKPTENVWFYEHPYPDGAINYSKTKPMRFEEFEAEINWWGKEEDGFAARVENQYAWKVSAKSIIDRNYNLDIKNPYIGEQISHDPDELLKLYNEQQSEIEELNKKLNIALSEASIEKTTWELLSDNFDMLFSKSESIQPLKQTILQLVTSGRFETQNENDVPAKELFKKIEDELIKKFGKEYSEKLSRDKSTIEPSDFHTTIPENWVWCELQDLAILFNGKAHEQLVDEKGEYILINSSFVSSEGRVFKTVSNQLTPLSKGEIAIVMSDVPGGKALVKCYLVEEDNKYSLNQRIGGISASSFLDINFLMLVLNRNNYYLQYDDGKKQTNLKKIQILSCPVPLPPYEEQQRIVDKVHKLFGLCDSLKEKIDKANEIYLSLCKTVLEIVL